jgi:hypothetical protein
MTNTAQFLHDNAGDFPPTFKFVNPGDSIEGTVERAKTYVGPNLNGDEEESLVVNLVTAGEERWTVWVKPKSDLIRKLARAVAEAKPGLSKPTVEEGDVLSIAFVRTEPSSKKGFAPRKIYEVTCEAAPSKPASEVSAEDLV